MHQTGSTSEARLLAAVVVCAMEGIGGDDPDAALPQSGDEREGQRRRHRHHHHHHHHHHSKHHHRHHRSPAPPPAPVDDIEDMVPLDDWGLLEGGRMGAAATTIGFSPQPTSTRPVGVVIPRFVGRKRPRGEVGARTASSGQEEAGGVVDDGNVDSKKGASTTVFRSSSNGSSSLDHDGLGAPPTAHQEPHEEQDRELVAPPLPGAQRIWVRTFGCSHNVSDSEYMEGMLAEYGYDLMPETERDAADLWLLNSCTVKNPSEASVVNLIAKAKEQGKAVVVSGCVPQGDRHNAALKEGVSVIGVTQLPRVVEVVEQTLAGHTVRLLSKAPLPSLDLPKIRRNPFVEIIPLSTGCLGNCTYCKTRHARGKLGSYAVEAIVARAKAVLREGVTELWLSSEDTGAYGRDLVDDDDTDARPGLTRLLDALLPVLPSGAMLRLGMTNPPFILDQLEAVAAALRHPNVFSFLHVPVQAGSDRVLSAMNREYTAAEFKRVVDYLLEHVPGVTIATDVICGFPGETEEDFDETVALVAQYKFPVVNISQFYARPGTPAARMPKVPTHVVKDRSRRMTRLFEGFSPYAGMEGQEVDVWVNSEVSQDGRHSVGHTKAYVKVLLPRDPALVGTQARARLLSTARFHVVGEVLSFRKVHASSSSAASPAEEGEGLPPPPGEEQRAKAKAMARARARKFQGEEKRRGKVAAAATMEEGGEEEEEEQQPEMRGTQQQAKDTLFLALARQDGSSASSDLRRSLSSSALYGLPSAPSAAAPRPLACTVLGPNGAILTCALAKKPGGCSSCLGPPNEGGGEEDCSCSSASRTSDSASASSTATSFLPTGAAVAVVPPSTQEREAGGVSWRGGTARGGGGGGGTGGGSSVRQPSLSTTRCRGRGGGGRKAGALRWVRSELTSPSFWALVLLLCLIAAWLAACAGLW